MMYPITICDATSGRMLFPAQVISWEAADLQAEVNPGCLWIEGTHDGDTHYVVDGVPQPRPVCPPYDHTSLTGAPDGSTVTIRNEDDETLVLEYPLDPADPLDLIHPGVYRYRVDPPFPYIAPEPGEITLA